MEAGGATSSIRIRVTPEFKALVTDTRTKLNMSEAELIIAAVMSFVHTLP